MSSRELRGSKTWSRDDLLVLLCTLNLRIDKIRREFDEEYGGNRKDGIVFATDLLSRAVGKNSTSARVKRKLEDLWNRWGPEYGPKCPDPLYRHGAYTRTLPGLNGLFPGILEEIASKVRSMQGTNSLPDDEFSDPPQNNNARSLRPRQSKDDSNDSIECRCGFSHYASTCVECVDCLTWQHIHCYYYTDLPEAAPKNHRCEKCNHDAEVKSEESLERVFERCRMQPEQNGVEPVGNVSRYGATTNNNNIIGLNVIASSESDEDVRWGPDISEICRTMEFVGSQVRRVANSISSGGFSLEQIPRERLDNKSDLVNLFQSISGNRLEENHTKLPPGSSPPSIRSSQVVKALIASAIVNWIFYPQLPGFQSMDTILFDRYRDIILSKNGFAVLRCLHRIAWTSLTEEETEKLDKFIAKEADELTHRLENTLKSFVALSASDSRAGTECWDKSSKVAQHRFKVILQTFSACLKLKTRLPLTENYYELYFPQKATKFDKKVMTLETGDPVEIKSIDGGEISLCILPAVIEYSQEISQKLKMGTRQLFGEQNFIKVTDDERRNGRVICRAVVTI